MRRGAAAISLLAVAALGAACGPVVASEGATAVFYVVNATGREVRLRASADGHELFTVQIDAARRRGAGDREAPPPGPHPAREIKASLPAGAARLVVADMDSSASATFDVPATPRSRAGFRITVEPGGISIRRDYRPIR
jgi:hypothetical protein